MKNTLLSIAAITSVSLFSFTSLKEKTYKVDTKKSTIVWTGKKVTGEHKGTVPFSSGQVVTDGQNIKSGTFDINLAALTVTDITEPEKNAKLVGHLKNEDFFATDKYPVAKLSLTKVTLTKPNQYEVTGNLTIKGITQPVSFPAEISITDKDLSAKGTITINRTKYDIKYRSTNYFENLGDKAIYDDFTLDFNFSSLVLP